MSSPYGWGVTSPQSSSNGAPESAPAQANGYSQQSPSYGFNNQPQPTPQYGFNNQPQSAPQYGFGAQTQQSQPQQGDPQYGFGTQQPPQGSPQYGFGAQQLQGQQYQQDEPYGFNNGQDAQQPISSSTQQYQQGINSQPLYMGDYPSMQGQFDSSNEYNIKAVLGFIFVFLFWPVGLVLSILGRNEINRNGGKGKGLTTASFVLCGIDIVVTVVAIVFTVMAFTGASDYSVAYDEPHQGYSYSQDSAYYGSTGADNIPAILQNENNKVILDQTHERNN